MKGELYEMQSSHNGSESPASTSATALLTGATGFVGRELLHHLLERHPDLRLIALVRARDEQALAERRRSLVRGLSAEQAGRLEAVRGDIAAPRMGLDEGDWGMLLERLDRVVHCAASVRFDLPLADARRENVRSTEELLALCRLLRARGRSGRLDHVSTAFVAGRRQGLVGEEELNVGQTFRNTYEQTKLEAEQLCRDARQEIPVAIYRPSIVVGRQRSGETSSYKAAYGPMRMLIQGYNACPSILNRLVPLPLPPDLVVDLVPVDYVAAMMAALWDRDDAAGRCYHLAAGSEGAAKLRDLVYLACDHFGTPRLRFVTPGPALGLLGRAASPLIRLAAPKLRNVLSVTYAYGLGMPVFDTTNARGAGLAAPRVVEYFERILAFASRTHFGRRRENRERTALGHAAPTGVIEPAEV
jgi:thioester reductase-like protein